MTDIDEQRPKMRSRLQELVRNKEIRLNRRITQSEIVLATGLNPNTVSRWMSPKPFERFEVDPLIKLCDYLDCEIGDLLYIDRG